MSNFVFDFEEITSERNIYRKKKGVRFKPLSKEPKPYYLLQMTSSGWPTGPSIERLTGLAEYYYQPASGDAAINNHHMRRIRGHIDGIQHFTESIVEFTGLKRQLWSLLHQGLRTLTRRRGGYHLRDLLNKGTVAQVPSMYLLWQFALAPLYYQIQDTIKKMSEISVDKLTRVHTSGPIEGDHQFYSDGVYKHGYIRKNLRVSYTSVFRYTVNNSFKAVATEFLGLNRPLTTLWDLKGWSWAVDYFFNLGELLANLDGEPLTRKVEYLSHSTRLKFDVYHSHDTRIEKEPKDDFKASMARKGYNLLVTVPDDRGKDSFFYKGGLTKIGEFVRFVRTTNSLPMNFVPEWKFKPKFGTFQFANLASAIALSLKSHEVDPHLLQPFKKGHTNVSFKPKRI